MSSFKEQLEADKKKFGLGGGGATFKFKEGSNKMRVLTLPVGHQSEYNGKPNTKFVCHIIDRADGLVKLAFLSLTVSDLIAVLEESEDYKFSEFPMPYDIIVNANGAGTKEVVYSVLPTRESDLTPEEVVAFTEATPIPEIIQRLEDKANQN